MAVAAMTMKVPMAAAVPKVSCDMFHPPPVLTQWVLGERQLSYGRRWRYRLRAAALTQFIHAGFVPDLLLQKYMYCVRGMYHAWIS